MLKATLFFWCFLLATSSYNAQFAIQSPYYQGHSPYLQPDYPITDPSSYYQPFYNPLYQQQYDGPEDGKDYLSSIYFRKPDVGLLNATRGIGNQDEFNIAGRTKIGNKQNQAESPVVSTSYPQRIGARPGRPTRPIIGRPRPAPGANPSEPDADNKQRPTPFLNWLRRILLRFIAVLARIFPNLYSTVYSTQTFTEVSTCTVSTTACAGRRRRAFIEHLVDHSTDEQLEKEMSSSITPESESSVAAMKLLDKREADPDLDLRPFHSKDLDTFAEVEGSIYNPEDQEEIKKLRKHIKMSPLKAAQLAKQLGLNTITIVTSTTVTTTTRLTPTCSTQGTLSQCPK